MDAFSVQHLESYREGNRLEAKRAQGGLPRSVWETYSAFANTNGGVILLGVEEDADNNLRVVGLAHPERMTKTFWDAANNPNKVSRNILSTDDVAVHDVEGAQVVVIRVPRADPAHKPVYVGGNPVSGTYRRNGEGDYHCSDAEYRAMVRDSVPGNDRTPLDELQVTAIDAETVRRYRHALEVVRPDHPWTRLSDEELLMRLGALVRSSGDGAMHPTRVGLLMFGQEWEIARVFPSYFLEYREAFSDRRWDDRIVTNDGTWSGNLFDFWRRVSVRLVEDLPRPFRLNDSLVREDDTPLHAALREALANCIIHADYEGELGVSVVRERSRVTLVNPGSFRIPLDVAQRGGISSTRNPTIMTMFNLIGVGERAGSGFDAMRAGCDFAHLPYPTVEESYGPDAVRLVFDTVDARLAGFTPTGSVAVEYESSLQESQRRVVELCQRQGSVARVDVERLLGIKRSKAGRLLESMVASNQIEKVGRGRGTTYRIA